MKYPKELLRISWRDACFTRLSPHTVDCPPLTAITNGMISYSTGALANGNYPSGTKATYTCTRGDLFDIESTRLCQPHGIWSDTDPTCAGQELRLFVWMMKLVELKRVIRK